MSPVSVEKQALKYRCLKFVSCYFVRHGQCRYRIFVIQCEACHSNVYGITCSVVRMCRLWGMTKASERRAVWRQTEVTVGLWTFFVEWKQLSWWGVQNNAGVKRIKGWNRYPVGEERQKGLTLLLYYFPSRKTFSPVRSEDSWREEVRISYVQTNRNSWLSHSPSRYSPYFIRIEYSLPCTWDPANGSYGELYQCNPPLSILLTHCSFITLKYPPFSFFFG